ncbi:energy-coupling factor transporter ATP-binding protein EcfA2 [Oxobacter pfennigii]|uniref:Energy-coupling factor transporter ATP-binding protein EcfA2 n=1 Tax=Oxobacter pfennigii TaxID=36849 RepID=A0A0P8W4H7_9CLOT|nr:ABC transporter ATP-binding protein [Oxobacter pfennigii]KPU42386.1 energy-coupling factor transporter ATP-binding protein EcfA2 [Oxobacter pfennigii]
MPQGIISIKGLSFTYPGDTVPSLKNIGLEINEGDFTAIIGSNGSGKTTLCKVINGVIPHYITGDFEGTVEVKGKNTLNFSVASLALNVAYVYQDFENQLVRSTVHDDVIFAPLNFGYTDYKKRGEDALKLLSLEHIKDKFIWELSGGQKHMAALAGVMSLNPDIIIVDEPAAQLDPVNAVLIYEKLKALNEVYRKTVIVIEHHSEFIADYCNSVIMMDEGRLLWKKDVKEALNSPELKGKNIYPPQVTQAAYILSRSSLKNENFNGYPISIKGCREYFGNINMVSVNDDKGIELKNSEKKPAIVFEGVSYGSKALDNEMKLALNDINLTVYEGERLALVGSNVQENQLF